MTLLSRLRSWLLPTRDDAPSPLDVAANESGGDAPLHEHASEHASRPSCPDAAHGSPGDCNPQLDGLASVGGIGGPSIEEALATLRVLRGTMQEATAVARILGAVARGSVPEPIRVACAEILAARGDERAARALLAGTTGAAGLTLTADLDAEAGHLAHAIGTIERVLARDLDAPGARERHRRWTDELGCGPRAFRTGADVTEFASKPGGGPFRLLREVARGGSGAVYEAEDALLGRRLAFKVYHRRGDNRIAVEHEARVAAALAGTGIVRLFDADPSEGWVALEWIARGSIRNLLRSGDAEPLVPFERWARPLARALARIHDAGLVHADVKPANVLLRHAGDAVLGDFGMACAIGSAGDGGSPGYVSPERIGGRGSATRDDVYGYGRVLEDALHRLEIGGRVPSLDAWRALSLACIGPDEQRPVDGRELVRRVG